MFLNYVYEEWITGEKKRTSHRNRRGVGYRGGVLLVKNSYWCDRKLSQTNLSQTEFIHKLTKLYKEIRLPTEWIAWEK